MTIADQQPIKGSPKAKAMEPGKGSETKRSFSGNGEDDNEADYWAYPNEVRQLAPIVERLWLEPGRRVFPHVKLKCETSLSLYWDKGGVELKDVEWDANGEPILELPPFVQQAYAAKST